MEAEFADLGLGSIRQLPVSSGLLNSLLLQPANEGVDVYYFRNSYRANRLLMSMGAFHLGAEGKRWPEAGVRGVEGVFRKGAQRSNLCT